MMCDLFMSASCPHALQRPTATTHVLVFSGITWSSVAAPNQPIMGRFDELHSFSTRSIQADNCNDLLGGSRLRNDGNSAAPLTLLKSAGCVHKEHVKADAI